MLSLQEVEDQLKRVGCTFRFWGRPEVRELRKILMPDETIAQAVNGRYENGFAMLCVTDHRLLLIDKKPMFLTLEDIRFDMISEIDYSVQLVDSTVKIITPNRTLVFMTWSHVRLRNILNYAQQRVSEIRQHYMQRDQYQADLQSQTADQMGAQPWDRPQWSQQVALPQRSDEYSAPTVGGLALQGTQNAQYGLRSPVNPYTRSPLIMRRHRIPKFY